MIPSFWATEARDGEGSLLDERRGMGADRAAFADGCACVERVDDRRVISGIVHVLKSGCRWCDCPEAYGPYTTIYNRFVRWARRGIWDNLFRELAGNGRSADTQMIDSTHVKAHRSAAGGKGGNRNRLWPLTRRAQHEDSCTCRC